MAAIGAVSKVRGTTKSQSYPQTEGLLSETMVKYGKGLGDTSDLGKSLCDAADAYRQMADVKYKLEDMVKHDFLFLTVFLIKTFTLLNNISFLFLFFLSKW